MTYILKQGLFILICVHYYCHCYNNFNELKADMEMRVSKVSDSIQNIYTDKCSIDMFQCPVKSFNVCEGTDQRTCITQFPVTSNCPGISKYSMTSGIRIPNSVASFNLSDQMKFFICKTAQPKIQSVLEELITDNDKRYAWITFGSSIGVSRISPGFKYQKQNASSSCKNYDPRLRPWYNQNAYGRKKFIILIQNSKGIYEQPNRFTSIQMSVQAILKTSQQGDLFNIIEFSDSPRLLFSQKDMKLVSLNAQYDKYDKQTNFSGLFYQSVANSITKSKSIEANYKKALQLALEVFDNSHLMNPEMENFILFFAGFKPTNSTVNYSTELATMLSQKQHQLSTDFYFFSFGVTLLDQQGIKILNSLSCKYDGIYIELSDVTYESMFIDQAVGFFDYLTQGNQVKGCRWTDLYEDAFGLGKMVSVVKPSYYVQNNVSRLIGVASMDVLLKQLTAYLTIDEIHRNLQVTKLPFKKNISICALQSIRRNYRCHKSDIINCTNAQFCHPLITPQNQSVIKQAIDTSHDNCCIQTFENSAAIIIGIVFGVIGAVLLIALGVYCFIFRKRRKTDLQKTYAEIFSQFKDFDRTRIRSDSEISIIKD